MMIGINDNDDGSPFIYWRGEGDSSQRGGIAFTDSFKSVKISQIKPSVKHLVDEQRRRHIANGEVSFRINYQAGAMALFNWLVHNPLTDPADISFVRQEVGTLATLALAREKARTESTELKWSGSAPYVRLCHAVSDVEEKKEAFIVSFRVLTAGLANEVLDEVEVGLADEVLDEVEVVAGLAELLDDLATATWAPEIILFDGSQQLRAGQRCQRGQHLNTR